MGEGERLLASSCRNGIGLNRGVVTSRNVVLDAVAGFTKYSSSAVDKGGNMSRVDVTSSDLSTARKYLPTDL